MHFIQILLPLRDNDDRKFPQEHYEEVTRELTNEFGGVTSFVRSPAVGIWRGSSANHHDDMLLFEVLADQLDEEWWANYKKKLKKVFRQEEVLIWASTVTKL